MTQPTIAQLRTTPTSATIDEPVVDGIYRHFKGGVYRIFGIGQHTENGEVLVAYQEVYHNRKVWFRPLKDDPKAWMTPQSNGEPRFTRVE